MSFENHITEVSLKVTKSIGLIFKHYRSNVKRFLKCYTFHLYAPIFTYHLIHMVKKHDMKDVKLIPVTYFYLIRKLYHRIVTGIEDL